jgi:CspA family cold shock protein
MKGIVKWFDVKKGYGFIQSPEVTDDVGEERDIVFHHTKIKMEGFRKVETSEEVSFDLVWSDTQKPQADNVVRLDPAPSQV